MPRNDQIERLFQLLDIELTTYGDRRGDVVARAVRLKLVDEPQSFLGKAQREQVVLRPIDGPDRGNLALLGRGDQLGQLGDTAALKQRLQGQADIHLTANLRDQL